MATKVIIQGCENPKLFDILTKEPGYPADHYIRVNESELDEWIEKTKLNFGGAVEIEDLRK